MNGIQQISFATTVFAKETKDFTSELEPCLYNISEIIKLELLEEHSKMVGTAGQIKRKVHAKRLGRQENLVMS